MTATQPDAPPIRYHGSKWLLAPWILAHIPAHRLYCEPYSGGAAVLLRKDRSYLEILNDLDGEIVNFFRILRDDPDPLIHAITLTPFAKAEWEQSFEPAQDPIEQARRFYVRAYMNLAGPTAQWRSGWRRQKIPQTRNEPVQKVFMRTDHLYQVAERLRGVAIESDEAPNIIERYDHKQAIFYLDPPYVTETRGVWKQHGYKHEMSDQDHRELAAMLNNIKGMAIISGYQCPLYDELFSGWKRVEKEARINRPGSATESLWLSPNTVKKLTYHDLPLFKRT